MLNFSVVWKVFCLKCIEKIGEVKTSILVDDGSDPNYDCPYCGCSSNHLPPTKVEGALAPNYRIDRWQHYKILIGRVYDEELIALASKDKRDWKDNS